MPPTTTLKPPVPAQTPQVRLMTTADLLAMPEDDNVDRYLIRGMLRETPVAKCCRFRNRWQSGAEANITYLLQSWLAQLPRPPRRVYSGKAGCVLQRDPDSTIGIDVVYVSPEVAALDSTDTTMIDGVPVLAVEILSPSDTFAKIDEKTAEYLRVGVAQTWLVNTRFRTVQVFRPGQAPQLFNEQQELSGEPELPGFRVAVAQIFSA